jgi:hypothetical protein
MAFYSLIFVCPWAGIAQKVQRLAGREGDKLDETYKIQTPGNYPEESIQHSEHSESLKSRIKLDEANSRLSQFFELA